MQRLLGGRCLSEGGVYFTFLSPNTAFIRGQRLKEEIRYPKMPEKHLEHR